MFRALDQFNFVAIRVGDKCDDGGAAFDGPGLARHIAATLLDLVACPVHVAHAKGDVTKRTAHVVTVHTVVVGQLNLRMLGVVAVADERQRVFVLQVFRRAQQLHAQNGGVKIDRALQIANADHGVK